LFQHGRRRRSSSARVYKFSCLCSGFASISGTTSGKSEVDMSSYAVHAAAKSLNTCRASRACRDERVAPCCPTSATRLATTFPYAKMHVLGSVSCRDVTLRAKWTMGYTVLHSSCSDRQFGCAYGRLSAADVEVDGIRPTKASVTYAVGRWTVSVRRFPRHHGGVTVYITSTIKHVNV